MVNESTLEVETDVPISMTCANATGIEKGSILKLTDPFTASISSAASDIPAGIAAEEKIANDGKTKIAVYRGGIFKVSLSGSCTSGDSLTTDAATNMVKSNVGAKFSGSKIIGIALETGADGETILMELNPSFTGYAKEVA